MSRRATVNPTDDVPTLIISERENDSPSEVSITVGPWPAKNVEGKRESTSNGTVTQATLDEALALFASQFGTPTPSVSVGGLQWV